MDPIIINPQPEQAPQPADHSAELLAISALQAEISALKSSMDAKPSSSDLEALRAELTAARAKLDALEVLEIDDPQPQAVDPLPSPILEIPAEPEHPRPSGEAVVPESPAKRGWSLW